MSLLAILIALIIMAVLFAKTFLSHNSTSIESDLKRQEQIQQTIDNYQDRSRENQNIEIDN